MSRALFMSALFCCLTYICIGCGDKETGVLGTASVGVDASGGSGNGGSGSSTTSGTKDGGGGDKDDSGDKDKVPPPKDKLPGEGHCNKDPRGAKNLTVSIEAVVKRDFDPGTPTDSVVLGAWALDQSKSSINTVVPVDFGKIKDDLHTGYGDALFVLSLCNDSNKDGSCLDKEKIYFQVSVKVATAKAALNAVSEFPVRIKITGSDDIVIRLTNK